MNAVLPKTKKDKEKSVEPIIPVQKNKISKKKTQFAVGQAVQSLAWTLAVGWARQKLKHLIEDERKTE
jgi:arginine exporter protein ArgO